MRGCLDPLRGGCALFYSLSCSCRLCGIVFLPAAGFRFDSNVNNVGDSGYYWSSTEYADYRDNAYRVFLDSRSIRPGSIANRGYGFSVRLTDIACNQINK